MLLLVMVMAMWWLSQVWVLCECDANHGRKSGVYARDNISVYVLRQYVQRKRL